MTGTIINTGAVILGGAIGLLLKKAMPDKFKTIYFQAVGLFTLAIGISMIVNLGHILIIVGSLVAGSLIGELLKLEERTEKFSDRLKFRLNSNSNEFTEGLISSFLLFCVGSMTILGTIQEGIEGKMDLLLTKSLMDFFSSILLASAFGSGVLFSAIPLFVFQAILTLSSKYASSYFTENILNGLTWTGGILLIGLAINILEIKKIKLLNMLPSLLIVILAMWIFT